MSPRRRAKLPAIAFLGLLAFGCDAKPPQPSNAARLAALRETHDRLHARLDAALVDDSLWKRALGDKGQIAIAIRSRFVQRLAGAVARGYLHHVTVDLDAVTAHASGELRKKVLFSSIKLGDWRVDVQVASLVDSLQAGVPRVRLRGSDLIDIDLPVEVKQAPGRASIQLNWDSSSVANLVCKDFKLAREVRGFVTRQQHELRGALRLSNVGGSLVATPVFPDRTILLKLELPPESWQTVKEALASQDSLGRCGLFLDSDRETAHLRELTDAGIEVKLPDEMFREVSLPAHFEQSVRVDDHSLQLLVKAESLEVTPAMLWSSASLRVDKAAVVSSQ